MNCPKKVKIDTVTYDIEFTPGPIIVDRKECKGSIDYNKNTIKLCDWIGDSQIKVTLMHEIAHGMTYERGIDIFATDMETVVDEMGKAMMQVIRDNPELVQYLID